ncbi:DNA ligase (ATP) [Mortierella alpina]|nr:DNA ligase (ATP) [Mortierella alpina]
MPNSPDNTSAAGSSAQPTSTNNVYPKRDDDPSVPSPPFHELVMLLEDITKRRTEKNQLLRKYFTEWRTNGYGSMFPVIRLLLPQLDRERGRYGLKESKMADLYISSLNILPGSDTADKLKHWKEGLRDSAGDFSLVVRDVVASRSLVSHPQGHTIRDVNQLLTGLSKKGSDNAQIFKTLVQSYTALENKWVVRIISKDLKIGMSENSVLPCYHPDAADLFNVCSDLRKTVLDCSDPTIRITTSSVALGQPFKPMLSKRLHIKEVVESMGNMPFWIETKLDGERVQVHKDGENYRYWSRNSTEFTHLYGANPKEGSLTPFIHSLFHPKATQLILDGEMVEYDPVTKQIMNFGTVKTAGGDHSDDAHKRRPMLKVFDVLFMNGFSLIAQPLMARQEMLPQIFPKESEGRLEIMPHQVGSTEQHIIDAIDAATMEHQEGVIVKNPQSAYVPNGRGQDWIKIKPEYMDGVFDSLDVLIVGGYYGTGTRGGQGALSSFLCAVQDNTAKSASGKKFLTFCKVGSGITFEMFGEISRLIGQHWKEYKHYRENPWVEMIDNAKMRPDVIIDPERSIVIEIKAAEFVANTDSYAAEYTLRFPRFMRIRADKDATSCLTMSEVHRMYRDFKGKLSTRNVDMSSSSHSKAKKRQTGPRKANQAHLLNTIVGDTSAVKRETDVFNGQVFWVYRGDDQQTKSELEVMIKRHGGKQTQSDQVEDTLIVAGAQGPELLGLKKKGHRNIVLPTWIRDCIIAQRLLPLNPKYMLFTTKATEKQFRQIMDVYEDSYTEPLSMESLQEILDKMPNRSEVIRKKRDTDAQERASKIKIKRLNNLEDQIDSSALDGDNDVDKDVLLELELDNLDGQWNRADAERARRITADLTRRYYGKDGESEPPLGMFQGVEVYVVYPPTPDEYLRSMTRLNSNVKEEHGTSNDRIAGSQQSFTSVAFSKPGDNSSFDTHYTAVSEWASRRERTLASSMTRLDKQSSSKLQEAKSAENFHWQYVSEENARQEELSRTLKTLSSYELCQYNLDFVCKTLRFHGARVVAQERCTIEHCQQRLRNRARGKIDDDSHDDVGVPLEIVVLFDPLYLDPLEQWKRAMQVSVLYGPETTSFEVPRFVTSTWVKVSAERKHRVPEEGYYPVA